MKDEGMTLAAMAAQERPTIPYPVTPTEEEPVYLPREDIEHETRVKLESRSTFIAWFPFVGFLLVPLSPFIGLACLIMGIVAWRTFASYGWQAPARLVVGTVFSGLVVLFWVTAFFSIAAGLMNTGY